MLKQLIILTTIVCGAVFVVNAQSVSRMVISSAGGTLTGGGSMITYNIGETVIPAISAGGNQITQGFEQPGEQITTGTISPLSYCAGTPVNVPFNAIDIGGGNSFTAQLSSATGSFAAPVNIGILSGNASGTVNATIPANTPSGSAYRIRVVSNSPGKNGSDNGVNIAISNAPPSSSVGTITSPSEGCNGIVSLISVNAVNGANVNYSWNTGTNSSVVLYSTNIGGPFTAGPFQTTTNQVYAQFGALAGSSGYNICVQGVNTCGSTNNKCDWIRGVVGVPGTIAPANAIACPNDVKSYSCGVSGGATVYNWTLSGSTTPVTSGQGTQNIQVTFPAAFTSGQLCVTASLSCGGSSTSAPRCMTISNTPIVPGAFTAGPSKICPGSTGVVFTVPTVTGATGYSWTVPAGTTITSGANTPSISVNFPNPYTGAPPVCVTANSSCASSVARCKTVGSNIPGQPGSVTGPTTNICSSTVQYSISNVTGATGYNWMNPAGTTITSGGTGTTILLQVSSSFVSGPLSVTAITSLCTPGISPARTITINGKPATPANIVASPPSFCNGGFVNFSTTAYSPAVTYNWTVSNSSITAGQNTNNIDVTWGTGTGNVIVSATNSCGANSPRTQSFTGIACREEGLSSAGATFTVHPNPAHDKVTVSINVKESADFAIQLMDVSGRTVLSETQSVTVGLNRYELNLSYLSKGVYMLEVKSASENWITKVVVQ